MYYSLHFKRFIHIKFALHGHVGSIKMDLWQVHNPIWFHTHFTTFFCWFVHFHMFLNLSLWVRLNPIPKLLYILFVLVCQDNDYAQGFQSFTWHHIRKFIWIPCANLLGVCHYDQGLEFKTTEPKNCVWIFSLNYFSVRRISLLLKDKFMLF